MSTKKLSKKDEAARKAREEKKRMKAVMKPQLDLAEKYSQLDKMITSTKEQMDEAKKYAKDNGLIFSFGDTEYNEDDYDDYDGDEYYDDPEGCEYSEDEDYEDEYV